MRLKVTGVRKVFSGIASCSRISSSSTRAMKRKPSAADDQDPADVLVVGAGRDLDPARAALAGSRRRRARDARRSWHFSVFDQADDAVLGGLDVGSSGCLMKSSYSSRRDDFDLGPHRRVGLAGEGRRLAVEGAFLVGAEDDLVGLARAPRRACRRGRGTSQVWIDVGRDAGRARPWCRPGRRACNRRRLRSGSRSATATAGRSPRSVSGSEWAAARPAEPVAGVSRALSVKTMLSDEDRRGEDGEHGADPELDARPPLTWRGSAPRSPR